MTKEEQLKMEDDIQKTIDYLFDEYDVTMSYTVTTDKNGHQLYVLTVDEGFGDDVHEFRALSTACAFSHTIRAEWSGVC